MNSAKKLTAGTKMIFIQLEAFRNTSRLSQKQCTCIISNLIILVDNVYLHYYYCRNTAIDNCNTSTRPLERQSVAPRITKSNKAENKQDGATTAPLYHVVRDDNNNDDDVVLCLGVCCYTYEEYCEMQQQKQQ